MNNEQLEKTKRIFFIILGIDILITLIFGIKAFLYAEIFQQIQAGSRVVDQALISNMELADKFRLLPVVTWLAVGYGLVKWLNACYRHAEERIGVKELKNRKWTILGWVIPFFNVYKPYQIINEIFKVGSKDYNSTTSWKSESSSTPLLIWWVFYFLSHFAILRIGMDVNSKLANPDVSVKIYISVFQEQIWLSIISIAIAILWLIVANYLTERLVEREPVNFTETYQNLLERTSVSKQQIEEAVSNTDEDQYFSQVAKEMVSGQRDEGLWAKAYALQDGDDKKTKAHYIRLRVEQLSKLNIDARPAAQPTVKSSHENSKKERISPFVWVAVVVGSIMIVGIITAMTSPSMKSTNTASSQGIDSTNKQKLLTDEEVGINQSAGMPVLPSSGVTPKVVESEVFITLEPITVELARSTLNEASYLQITLALGMSAGGEGELKKYFLSVRNNIERLLATKRKEDLLYKEGKIILANEIKIEINAIVDPSGNNLTNQIHEVLFTSFVLKDK